MSTSGKALPDKRLLAIAAVVSLASILYLPYLVPQKPTLSDSYVFRYNNHAGLALLLFFSIAGAIWTKGCQLDLRTTGRSRQIPLRALWICLGITLAACIGMYLFAGRFGGLFESSYVIDRVWLLSHGKRPYLDFEWAYGVVFLYGPLWLSHLLSLNIAQSYYLFWTISALAGIVLLFIAINLVDHPSEHKTWMFAMVYIAMFPGIVGMGTHYTIVRYACPLVFILILYKDARDGRRQFRTAALALLFTACLLAISPEVAISHAIACAVLLFPRRSGISPAPLGLPSYLAMVSGLAILFAVALRLHVLDTLRAAGGGANSLPIPFSFPVLLFFSVVFFCACAIVRRWSQPWIKDNTVALIVFSIPMLTAALGRCDPGHMLANGMGLFLAVAFSVSASPKLWWIYSVSFIFGMIVLPAASFYWLWGPTLQRVADGSSVAAKRLAATQAIDFSALYPGADLSGSDGVLQVPFGYKPNTIGSYLSNQIDYGYYDGGINVNTPAAVARKISELEAHPQRKLLLTKHFYGVCDVDISLERYMISRLFVFPYRTPFANRETIFKPFCRYIYDHFTLTHPPSEENFGYGLWRPKTEIVSRK